MSLQRMSTVGSTISSVSNENIQRFIEITQRFCTIAKQAGCNMKPYENVDDLHFSRLMPNEQEVALQGFQKYLDLCESVLADGRSVNEDGYMLWRSLSALKLRPPSDLFDTLSQDDFFEIFLYPENTQIFRCFKFFHVCSYTLDDLLSRPWWELFDRDKNVTASLLKTLEKAMAAPSAGRVFFDVGRHHLDEIDSARRFRCVVENKFLVPLFNADGEACAFLNVMRAFEVKTRIGYNDVNLLPNLMALRESPLRS